MLWRQAYEQTTDTAKVARSTHAPESATRGRRACSRRAVALVTNAAVLFVEMPRELVGLLGLALVNSLLMVASRSDLGLVAASVVGVASTRSR